MVTKNIKKPRILFVGAFPPNDSNVFGGNVTACRVLMQSSFPDLLELILLDSTQVSNPPPVFIKRLFLAVRRYGNYLYKIEKYRPNVVLIFTSSGAGLVEKSAMAWYARLRGRYVLIFPRSGIIMEQCKKPSIKCNFISVMLRSAHKILCQGKAWQNFAVYTLHFSYENAPIITNWTASPSLLAIGESRTYKKSDDIVRILFVGWLEKKKGVEELLKVCKSMLNKRSFVLDIVGEGGYSEKAREIVFKFGIENKVNFRGWLKEKDLENIFEKSDIFVLPSWNEGLPNAMIEAMATKLPVVVTSVGNIPDIVTDGIDALLVPPKNINALEHSLLKLIDSPSLRQELGNSAFLLAKSEWGVDQAIDKLMSVINSDINTW